MTFVSFLVMVAQLAPILPPPPPGPVKERAISEPLEQPKPREPARPPVIPPMDALPAPAPR